MPVSTLRTVAIALVAWAAALGAASAQPTPAPSPPPPLQDTAYAPLPTPDPLTYDGFLRAYYFTRQNASNSPDVRYAAPPAPYNASAVNQASFNDAVSLHAEYRFAGGGWFLGGEYFYGNPLDGPCVVAAYHAKGGPCVTQVPPNTNPDDTLPGFTLATFDQAYLGYDYDRFAGKIGYMLLTNPWAGSYDATRLKPAAYKGADLNYASGSGVAYEFVDATAYENRTSSAFSQSTLLTSYPAGNPGVPSNIFFPGGQGIATPGFLMGKVGYTSPARRPSAWSADAYYYGVADIADMYWGDARYTALSNPLHPFVALQGGWENGAGASYVGKIRSSVAGIQLGATVYSDARGDVTLSFGFDSIPWRSDALRLPAHVTCDGVTNQIKTAGTTFPYFLPTSAPACLTNAAGTTSVYYGGWASPYTDNYITDPLFTTSISQGMIDRRTPGTSYKFTGTFASRNKRLVFLASEAWYAYGNALSRSLPQFSGFASLPVNEWDLDATYRFGPVRNEPYKGLLVRYRYAQRTTPDTFFASGAGWLGGIPLFKYNRAQLEYDF